MVEMLSMTYSAVVCARMVLSGGLAPIRGWPLFLH